MLIINFYIRKLYIGRIPLSVPIIQERFDVTVVDNITDIKFHSILFNNRNLESRERINCAEGRSSRKIVLEKFGERNWSRRRADYFRRFKRQESGGLMNLSNANQPLLSLPSIFKVGPEDVSSTFSPPPLSRA